MSYILKLQEQNAKYKETLAAVSADLEQFRVFLHSAKFTGTENGERKDWISTGDVLTRLAEMRNFISNNS